MTLNPVYIESQERVLKNQSLLLHLGCHLSLIIGLGVVTLPPFLTSNKIIRISCLAGGFLLGCNVVLVASQLHSVTQKTKALEKAVKENFGLQLVTDQIMIQDNLKAKLMPQSVPMQSDYTPDSQHIPDNQLSESTEIIKLDEPQYLEIEQSQYNNVLMALERGDSDSVIIQDVLNCKGRKYQQGKAILAEIKEQSGYE